MGGFVRFEQEGKRRFRNMNSVRGLSASMHTDERCVDDDDKASYARRALPRRVWCRIGYCVAIASLLHRYCVARHDGDDALLASDALRQSITHRGKRINDMNTACSSLVARPFAMRLSRRVS